MGGAHVILSSGNKVFANDYSYIGDFGFNMSVLNYSGFMKQNSIEYTGIHTDDKDTTKLNIMRPFRKEDIDWAQNALYENEFELKQLILKNRSEQFEKAKVTSEQLEKELFSQAFVTAQKAKELG